MIVIIGAGPTGLAAGCELQKQGCEDFIILEAAADAGGLAGSVLTDDGYTWDHGGHVVFSHYGEFDKIVEEVMGDDVEHHDRSSFVYSGAGKTIGDLSKVPYPFQDHPRYLGPDEQLACLEGVVEASRGVPAAELRDLETWALATFGKGIFDLFFYPYNRKVWSTPLSQMSSSWVADRVSVPDLSRLIRNITHKEDTAWGPNATFTFPKRGGTGEIWRRLAAKLGDHIRYDSEVKGVDLGRHCLWPVNDMTLMYDTLINTMPLDRFAQLAGDEGLIKSTGYLTHNKVMVVGLGYREDSPPEWSWSYFPQPRDEVPFYRITNFGKYAHSNAPRYRTSYMGEISFAANEPWASEAEMVNKCHVALGKLGVRAPRSQLDHMYAKKLEYAYPVPTIVRDSVLRKALPYLTDLDVLSRGRFGAWRYELGNQDHSAMQGIEAAHKALYGTTETQVWDGLLLTCKTG